MSPIWHKNHEWARVATHWIGIVGFSVGLSSFCGQLSGQPILYTWHHIGAMALPTALVTMANGIGFFLVSRGEASHGETS